MKLPVTPPVAYSTVNAPDGAYVQRRRARWLMMADDRSDEASPGGRGDHDINVWLLNRRWIGAGEQRVVVSLSVLLRSVGGMSEPRFGRTPGGVCSLGQHLVWCSTYRCRVLDGRVRRLGELLEQIAAEDAVMAS